MSIKIITKVWDDSTHTGTALLAMLALADHANDEGYCWPGMDSIAHKVRIKWRQCINVIQALEESGEIFVDRGVGRGGTSKYLLTIGLTIAEIADRLNRYFDCPKSKAIPLAQAITEKVQRNALLKSRPQKVQRHAQKVQPAELKGATAYKKGAIAIASEPSLIVTLTKEETSLAADAAAIPNPATSTHTQEGTPEPGNSSPFEQSPIDDDVPAAPAPPMVKPAAAPRARNVMMDKIMSLAHTTPAMSASQVAGLIKKLKADGFNESHIDLFEMWWCQDWRSADKQGNRGIVPTVGQIGQLFGVAMAWAEAHAPKPAPLAEQLSPADEAELEAQLLAEMQAHEDEITARRQASGWVKTQTV